ncbi:hypothetical protein SELMODRAFT_16655, partial [Selaginella moellendorffii]
RDIVSWTSMISMYGQIGEVELAKLVFDSMPLRNEVSWNSMVSVYALNGRYSPAVEILRDMDLEASSLNDITFVDILSVCSHLGLLSESRSLFGSMIQDRGMVPTMEHFGCLVGVMGRSGHLEKAQELVQSMPYTPDSAAWMTLVGSCKLHHDVGRGSHAAKRASKLTTLKSAPYVLLYTMY